MQTLIQPRKAWLALLMSLALPGFGQLYNGQVNKAIWLFLLFTLLSTPGVALIALYLPDGWMMPALLLGLLATLALWLWGGWDAWRQAVRFGGDYLPRHWQTSGLYALVFLSCLMAEIALIQYVRDHQVQSFRIPSQSMEPGILPGDILFADMRYNCPGCKSAVQRGDVAIFVYPNNRTLNYIKRIVALPGDRVRLQGHQLWVNEQLLNSAQSSEASGWLVTETLGERHWQARWTQADTSAADWSMTVPPGQVLVLGDNRDGSQDSRVFGAVPLADVVGKARQIWFSWRPEGGVRWQRLGRVPD